MGKCHRMFRLSRTSANERREDHRPTTLGSSFERLPPGSDVPQDERIYLVSSNNPKTLWDAPEPLLSRPTCVQLRLASAWGPSCNQLRTSGNSVLCRR